MWPFNRKSLKNQDAVEKYRRWLKRWLLSGAAQNPLVPYMGTGSN